MSKDLPKNVELKPGEKVITESPTPLPEHLIKAPAGKHQRRWGQSYYPSDSFVRVIFLADGSLSGERWRKGKNGDVPKSVFDSTLKPMKLAKLWEKPAKKVVAPRPSTDVGSFRRR